MLSTLLSGILISTNQSNDDDDNDDALISW